MPIELLKHNSFGDYDSISRNDTEAQNTLSAPRKQKEESKRVETSRKKILKCIVIMLFAYTTGVVFYCYVENWTVIHALYFASVVTTTVGYGDFVPKHSVSLMFTCVYIIFLVTMVASVISEILSMVLSQETALLEHMLAAKDQENKRDFRDMQKATPEEIFNIIVSGSMFFLLFCMGVIWIMYVEKISFLRAVYFVIITSTTVGFGDIIVQKDSSRMFVAVWILLTTMSLASFLGFIADCRASTKRRRDLVELIDRRLSKSMLSDLDLNQDDKIHRYEFVLGALVHQGLIQKSFIDQMIARFDDLDRDKDGILTHRDVQVV